MKRWLMIIPVILLAGIMTFFFYDRVSHKDEKVVDYIKSLRSYTSDSNLIIVNDKQAVEYSCKQYYDKKNGERIEIGKDRIVVYKNSKAFVNDLKANTKYTVDGDSDIIFKISMISEYMRLIYTNEEMKLFSKNIEGIDYTVIELHMPHMNRNLVKGRLYINKDNKLPERLEVLDKANRIKVRVNYKNFIPNEEIDEGLFNL
ncbi:germination lipoprotein GerS-related protein [Clostridium malenominatum]|uniref:Germination lipoprotein GerS-related protein n=1 Tax=Clostridium malenominatum TaxID=1539 RepID=A0ABP3TRK0_9CLOT